jgi:two-component system, sensor histidine kinase
MSGEPAADQARPPLAERVLAEQMRTIIAQTPQGIAAPAALALISALVVWEEVARELLVLTLAALALILASWYRFYGRFRRAETPYPASRWARGTFARTLIHGAIWGAYSLLIFPADSLTYQSLDVAFMYGLVAGAVVVDGPHFPTFLAFSLPTILPVIVRSGLEGTLGSLGVGAAGLVGLGHACFAAFRASRITVTSIRTELENLELREVAERARAEAEAANLAKSRFLAAASHDLRQPVHALGLFAAAAKQARSDEERRAVVDRMDASVAALAALFDSLLEVSRLDAGVLEPRPETVPLRSLLARLHAEHSQTARTKGLALRLRCPDVAVRTDPLLLERLLRNLVSNALRYTERGGVLVAARGRADTVRVGVWDTGVGIAPEHRSQVFEEFFQVGNPERQREHGVGLGLAIVRRLAALLDAPLHITSRVGRGSCFAIDLPRTELERTAQEPGSATFAGDAGALLGVVVVIIDDEPASLAALELVLKQYGCHVVVASSATEALSALDARSLEPAVVVSDYRLRGGETGLVAAETLRGVHGVALPVVLITGDTAAEKLRDVRKSGFPVLHKPVKPEVLRRTLIGLLG